MTTFRDFMEAALYGPERGFYSGRILREDFYTAPELHPAFGGVLARKIATMLGAHRDVVEVGAGEGVLAEQILPLLADRATYTLIERCAAARERAQNRLARFANVKYLSCVESLEGFSGVLFSNELIDAFPVHVLEKSGGRMRELHVGDDGAEHLADFSAEALAGHAAAVSPAMADGERHAVNLDAVQWMAAVASKMREGYLLTIDYGKRFNGHPNPPRAYFRHSRPESLTLRPGRQDLTASVDFDVLITEGERLGFVTEAFETLSRFLIDGGVGDWIKPGDSVAQIKARAQVKTLLHPEGMGEAFKVLVQRKKGAVAS